MARRRKTYYTPTSPRNLVFFMWDWLMASDLNLSAKVVYARLCFHAYRKHFCSVKQSTLAKDLNMHERTVRSAMSELEDVGLIERVRQGQGKADVIYLLEHPMMTALKPPEEPDDDLGDAASDRQSDPVQTGNRSRSGPANGAGPIGRGSSKRGLEEERKSHTSAKSGTRFHQKESDPGLDDNVRSISGDVVRDGPPVAGVTRPRGKPRPGSANGLAMRLTVGIDKLWPRSTYPGGASNRDASARNISRWLRDGIEPEVIEAMIDRFLNDPARFSREDQIPWKEFFSSRAELMPRDTTRKTKSNTQADRSVEAYRIPKKALPRKRA